MHSTGAGQCQRPAIVHAGSLAWLTGAPKWSRATSNVISYTWQANCLLCERERSLLAAPIKRPFFFSSNQASGHSVRWSLSPKRKKNVSRSYSWWTFIRVSRHERQELWCKIQIHSCDLHITNASENCQHGLDTLIQLNKGLCDKNKTYKPGSNQEVWHIVVTQ